jgi:eukaryotic-like serine/threonine-protein kinase
VVALARVAGLLTMYGDLDRGRQFFKRAERRAEQVVEPAAATAGWLAWARSWRAQAAGEMSESLRHDMDSMRAFERAGDLRNCCYAQSNVGYAQMRLGLLEDAERFLRDALDTALRLDLRTISSGAAHNLGLVQSLLGKHDAALETELEAVGLFASLRSGRGETMSTEYLARIHLMRGDVASAERAARRARTLAGDWHSLVALCSASLARVLSRRGDHDGALAEATRAMELLELHGSADGEELYITAAYVASLLNLGKEAEALGALDEACESLSAAAARITDEDVRAAFLSRVPEHHLLLSMSQSARKS